MNRIHRLDQAILAQNRHDSFAQQNEFRMRNVEFTAVREMEGKRAKAFLQSQLDLIQIHRGETIIAQFSPSAALRAFSP